jgi:hypothetical protein
VHGRALEITGGGRDEKMDYRRKIDEEAGDEAGEDAGKKPAVSVS